MERILPKQGEKRFYMHRTVMVQKVYATFHLVFIVFDDDKTEACVDFCALTDTPDYTNVIPLQLLRGEHR